MPEWRNWYTRTTQNRVSQGIRVRLPSPALDTVRPRACLLAFTVLAGMGVESKRGHPGSSLGRASRPERSEERRRRASAWAPPPPAQSSLQPVFIVLSLQLELYMEEQMSLIS